MINWIAERCYDAQGEPRVHVTFSDGSGNVLASLDLSPEGALTFADGVRLVATTPGRSEIN